MATDSKTQLPPLCQYLERHPATHKLDECGEPAKYRGVIGPRLFYCAAHGDFLRRQFELATLEGVSLGKPLRWVNKLQRRY